MHCGGCYGHTVMRVTNNCSGGESYEGQSDQNQRIRDIREGSRSHLTPAEMWLTASPAGDNEEKDPVPGGQWLHLLITGHYFGCVVY